MRDIIVTLAVLACLPAILYQPYVGVLVWSWLSYMNPHRLAWGFAQEMPFAQIVALTTFAAMLVSKEPKRIPWTRETIVLLLFILWMVFTTFFARIPELAWLQLEKVLKIQIITFVTLMLMVTRRRVELLVWVIVLSLGFYGVKGGIFTLMTGGGFRVQGPLNTFIGGNNEIGLALIMALPLMRYLQLRAEKTWMRYSWTGAIGLTVIAILGTQSRGAFIAITAMVLFLILKSRKRFPLLFMIAILVPLAASVMPESWYERMNTIKTYELEGSVQGRFTAWRKMASYARQSITGAGFEAGVLGVDAHSIYFEVLGEHGYIGLAIYLLLGFLTWRSGSWIIRKTRRIVELQWARDLAAMLQVSMVGYGVAGAFLGLAYFDLYYHVIALMVLTKILVVARLAELSDTSESVEQLKKSQKKPRFSTQRPSYSRRALRP